MFKIVDPRDGMRATVASYTTREQAEQEIVEWLKRQERGGRTDIGRPFLLRLVVIEETQL
jgi:hypothetical protein